jgi:endonuclease-8
MPEGDTIHRIASALAPRLIGRVLERVTTQGLARGIAGRTVARVTAHGKHLVIELADGAHIRTHLGMYGRQRSYGRPEGEAVLAKLSLGRISLALVTSDGVHLWIGARTVEILERRAPLHGQRVAALGPDVLADDFDCRQAASRASLHGSRMVGEVLLDQSVAAGVGNIWRCESLFARGIDPRTGTSALGDAELEAIYATARELMQDSVAGDADRFAVYGRTGKPCRRCGSAIACYSLGDPPRWTWSCPLCQALRTTGGVKR